MPSWNEKPVAVASINVNLRPCTCVTETQDGPARVGWCFGTAFCAPILIPCPIPRSVPFQVRLGRCECSARFEGVTGFGVSEPQGQHSNTCPACPIRVSCSISGKTWEDSFVSDVDWQTRNERGDWNPSPMSPNERNTALRACGALWGVVKALVTGATAGLVAHLCNAVPVELFIQRDAVFAALADMARAESTVIQCFADLDKVYTNRARYDGTGLGVPLPSARELVAYVAHLIEQVGVMS